MSIIDRLNGVSGNVAMKAPCRAATTTSLTLFGLQTVDTVSLAAGDRVLVKNQANPIENGIYSASTAAWVRVVDFDGSNDAVNGSLVLVTSGSQANILYRFSATDPVVFGVSALTVVVQTVSATGVTTARQILAGTGLTGGGDLSADRTLSIPAGSINTDRLSFDQGPFSFRNKIINGRFDFNNYFGDNAPTTPTASAYVMNRWRLEITQASKITVSNSNDGNSPSADNAYYAKLVVASSFSPGSADFFEFSQMIEGKNCQELLWGTALAKSITFSAKISTSVPGTYCLSIRNSARTRSYVHPIVLASGKNTVTVTIPGDQAGTWLTDTNVGLRVGLSLGHGTSFNTTADAWQAGNFVGTSAQTQWVSNAAATFYVSDVQVEVGTSATPFERRHQGIETLLCQGYYQSIFEVLGFAGYGAATQTIWYTNQLATGMRAVPTASLAGSWSLGNCSAPSVTCGYGHFRLSTTVTALGSFSFILTAGCSLNFDAELT